MDDQPREPGPPPARGVTLRSVALGIAVAMGVAALLPLIVALWLLPALEVRGSDPRIDSGTAGASVADGLDRARTTTLGLAANPAVRQLLGAASDRPLTAAAQAALQGAADAAPGLRGIVVYDAAGKPRFAWADGALLAPGAVPAGSAALAAVPPPATTAVSAPVTSPGDHRVAVTAGLPPAAGSAKVGTIQLLVSLDALAAPGGGTGVGTPGSRGEPWPIVALLAGLVAASAFAIWQVLRPARELAASRAKLSNMYEEAVTHAYIDVITGLGNQRAFQEEFERQLELARREHFPVALLLLDLDDFKRVNDTAGHAAGDQVLARFGRLIESIVRRSDRAFRTGGDEFAIVMPATDVEGADVVARRLLAIALEPEHGRLKRDGISFSGGIAAAPHHGSTRIELFTQADAALYWSKRHGRTNVTIFDPGRHQTGLGSTAHELAAAVAQIVDQRSLRAVFQPIVELSTGRVIGYEGLVRPTAPPFRDPGSLFAAAEAGGRTVALDRACLDTVAEAAAVIPPEQFVSINLSPRTLEAPEFNALALCRHLARLGLPAQRIVLELTEREAVEDLDRLRRNLEACRALGVRVAADDVGAGNAGLRLLSLVPFDVVKIDLSLVQDAATHQTSAEVLDTLRELAQRRGAMVIAEGLETTQQLEVVRAARIDAAQGYLFGRPAEAVDMEWLDIEAIIRSDRLRRSFALPGADQSVA